MNITTIQLSIPPNIIQSYNLKFKMAGEIQIKKDFTVANTHCDDIHTSFH